MLSFFDFIEISPFKQIYSIGFIRKRYEDYISFFFQRANSNFNGTVVILLY